MSSTRNKLPSRFVRRLGSTVINRNIDHDTSFSDDLMISASDKQQDLLIYFEKQREVLPKFSVRQEDFTDGTLRITKPGNYILRENIVFNPSHQFPTPDQYDKYPIGKEGPYHLGFFAAIAVESDDVIIDLNGYTIKQSKRHNLLQRFFSIIELANSPFIPKQGPHSFIDSYKATHKCLVTNGTLDNSSHHGVHGNKNSGIVLHKLKITEFEVAAVALNGASESIISDCSMIGKRRGIPVLSSFSQGIFTERALSNLKATDNTVYKELDADLQKAYGEIMTNKKQTTYFENKSGQYDGNMYGIVLHVAGVVIQDFLKERPANATNNDILIHNVTINNIETLPVEIVALGLPPKEEKNPSAYGGKQMVGAFGDVLDIEKIMDEERKYKGNSLSNAQLYLAENHSTHGTVNIKPSVVEWSKSNKPLSNSHLLLPLGDSMGHIMKGNIGVFISGGKNITLDGVSIDNVRTNGNSVGTSSLLSEDQHYFQGANSYGLLMTATNKEEVELIDVTVTNILSENPKGIGKKIEVL